MEIFIFDPILMGRAYYFPRAIWGKDCHKIIEKLSESETWCTFACKTHMSLL